MSSGSGWDSLTSRQKFVQFKVQISRVHRVQFEPPEFFWFLGDWIVIIDFEMDPIRDGSDVVGRRLPGLEVLLQLSLSIWPLPPQIDLYFEDDVFVESIDAASRFGGFDLLLKLNLVDFDPERFPQKVHQES